MFAAPFSVSITGTLQVAGGRNTAVVAVPGARNGMSCWVTPRTDTGNGIAYGCFISANDQVTVWMMISIAGTPPTTTFDGMIWQ